MRVLVCGGRAYSDEQHVFSTLDALAPAPTLIIHGDAGKLIHRDNQKTGWIGADKIAGRWAELRKVPVHAFPARWDIYGNRAGPIRNQVMIDRGLPDLVVSFPGHLGTEDMKRRAIRAGIEVREISK